MNAKTDEERRAVCDRLYQAWIKAPHLRFAEMIENCLPTQDMHNISDSQVVSIVLNYVRAEQSSR